MNHDVAMEYMVMFAKVTVLTGIYIGVTFFTWAAVHDKELTARFHPAIITMWIWEKRYGRS